MILFLDIDGTCVRTLSKERFGKHPKDFVLMRGVEDAVTRLADATIVGVSNQGGVEFGFKTLEDCLTEQRYKLTLMPWMQSIYFCPDMDGNKCFVVCRGDGEDFQYIDCLGLVGEFQAYELANFPLKYRKPDTGMLNEAFLAHNISDFQKENVWMIGDRYEDRDCARNAKINFAWASEWRNGQITIERNEITIIEPRHSSGYFDDDPIPF